jgi:hypothetical protein
VCSRKSPEKAEQCVLVVLWCSIRANAGGMLVMWKNAEKGASSSRVRSA